MAGGLGERTLTFWGMVGAVMVALKLKGSWDEYREVSSEEDGLGPVALRSPRDDEFGDSTVHDGLLDTEIPGAARPTRKRSKECCMCCGMRCGLFWKAFGIVCLIFAVWQGIKLIMWAVTPSPTGLEDMPAYSVSLGCVDAPYIFHPEQTSHSVPIGTLKADHSIDIAGAAVGTLTLAQGAADATDVEYDITVRTDDKAHLDYVSLQYPTTEDVENGAVNSRLMLTTRASFGSSCMRYDITLRVPPTLKMLHIITHSVTHVQFDPEAKLDLNSLFVTMHVPNSLNMLKPTAGVRAKNMTLEMTRGWLVGDVSIVDKTTIYTQRGDALTNLHVHPVPSLEESPATAKLQTTTGAGRTDIFYENDRGVPHRPINSKHRSSRHGDIYLTYKDAEYNGKIDFEAKSYSARNVQGSLSSKSGGEMPWVGDKDGGDSLIVRSGGWVGLYF